MDKKKTRVILISLLVWYGLFFMRKLDLTTADLGRHIKNGEMILSGQTGVLGANFYSYTEPDFPVINHHWGSGVIFYLIWRVLGFSGLSFFYLFLNLIIFYLFFRISQKEAGFKLSLLVSLLLIPLMTARTEIRSEIFSYLFITLFFWTLWHWRQKKLNYKWLFVLPVLEILWVNAHIYFIFGPGLVGLFWLDNVIKKKKFDKKLGLILILTTLGSLLNPIGLKGALYPFDIFKNYGYQIVENKSVWFLEKWGFDNPNLKLFEISLGILILSFVLLLIRNRKKLSFVYFILAIIWGILGWEAIRNFAMFGLFSLPIIAYNIRYSKFKMETLPLSSIGFLIPVVLLVSFSAYKRKLPLQKHQFGFGLMENNSRSAEFFKKQNLQGPIFNNYDIGGYLIYHFYPHEKVFTDNRPEAYSIKHFQETYIPAQADNDVWQKLNDQYHFNVIYFSHQDYTPWGQQFLIERTRDDDWAAVYFDPYAIIFLKKNQTNQSVIERFEIPKEAFGTK